MGQSEWIKVLFQGNFDITCWWVGCGVGGKGGCQDDFCISGLYSLWGGGAMPSRRGHRKEMQLAEEVPHLGLGL